MNEPKTNTVLSKSNQGQGNEDEPQLHNEPTTTNSTGDIRANNHETTIKNLPPEVLEEIFQRVESPKDLLSCWNTSSAWNEVLQTTEFCFKMALPFIMAHLNRKDILACSKVSKFWNKAVDACVQEILPEDFQNECKSDMKKLRVLIIVPATNMPYFLRGVTRVTEEGSPQQLQILPVANPVTFRRVRYVIWASRGRLQRATRPLNTYTIVSRWLLMCLNHHGHLIRHFHLSFGDDNVSCLERIKLIQSCLKLTPNLRVLVISQSWANAENDVEMVAAFHQHMTQNPWPPLEHLNVLTFDSHATQNEFVPIANAYGSKLLYLKFGFKSMEPNQLLGGFSCLQKIFFYFNEASSGVRLGAFVQSSKCPLKELVVEISVEPDEKNYVGLTAAANAASATLETLHFYYVGEYLEYFSLDTTKLELLKLPKLKMLTLETFCYPSLDFLKSVCPAIETLIVTPYFLRNRGETLDGCMSELGDMYENLYSQQQFWKELADIRSVTVKYLELVDDEEEIEEMELTQKVFTRHEYDEMLKI